MPVHLLNGTVPHRCEKEKLKDDEGEKERRVWERERERTHIALLNSIIALWPSTVFVHARITTAPNSWNALSSHCRDKHARFCEWVHLHGPYSRTVTRFYNDTERELIPLNSYEKSASCCNSSGLLIMIFTKLKKWFSSVYVQKRTDNCFYKLQFLLLMF